MFQIPVVQLPERPSYDPGPDTLPTWDTVTYIIPWKDKGTGYRGHTIVVYYFGIKVFRWAVNDEKLPVP